MNHQISQSNSLYSIPERKLVEALENTIRNCSECSQKPNAKLDQNLCRICVIKNTAIGRYAQSNIPVKYWSLEMEKNFHGDEVLLETYRNITGNFKKHYQEGVALCFAGGHGRGKTLTVCNILKRAVEKNYSALYVNLNDIVNTMLNAEDRSEARKELLLVDFLVIDEFDARYMANDKASDLFGKILEEIVRTRHQNNLPIFLCTNTINVVDTFHGSIKESISSLMSCVKTIAVLGRDFRVNGGK